MSQGAWTWHKAEPKPVLPKKVWTAGKRVKYRERKRIYSDADENEQFSGIIQGIFPKFLLILTDYGYRTCVGIYDAEKYMEEL